MTEPAKNLYGALLAVQAEAPTLQKSAINPHFKSKFVPLDKVHEVVMPLLNKHGLLWLTLPGFTEAGPILQYRLVHLETEQEITGAMPLLPAKADPQGQGSAITYARRYSLMAVLGLVADEDDDGNAGSNQTDKRAAAKPSSRSGGAAKTTPSPVSVAEAVAELPGTVELVGPATVEAIKALRADVGLSAAALKAHVVATHGKDSLEALTLEEGRMVSLWLDAKKAKAAA